MRKSNTNIYILSNISYKLTWKNNNFCIENNNFNEESNNFKEKSNALLPIKLITQ